MQSSSASLLYSHSWSFLFYFWVEPLWWWVFIVTSSSTEMMKSVVMNILLLRAYVQHYNTTKKGQNFFHSTTRDISSSVSCLSDITVFYKIYIVLSILSTAPFLMFQKRLCLFFQLPHTELFSLSCLFMLCGCSVLICMRYFQSIRDSNLAPVSTCSSRKRCKPF